ncbi:MAG: hypothetical protein HYY18_12110 [Planctomycetes bacterium]|nr:hypothetical protein [Planctomycetota bacterium]
MKRIWPAFLLASVALADDPEILARARKAQGGGEVLAAVKNVRLQGRLTLAGATFPYTETWTRDAIVCVYDIPGGEVTKGWDGASGWVDEGTAVAMSEGESLRIREGLALRNLLLLRFPEDPVPAGEGLQSGAFRIEFGDADLVETVRFASDEAEAAWKVDRYAKTGAIRLPMRWRASVKDLPAASATWTFTKAELDVDLPEGFFRREVRGEPGDVPASR